MPVPIDHWPYHVTVPETTPAEACRQGVEAEQDNMRMYDRISVDSPEPEFRRVLENLQSASRDRHLPAFERCIQPASITAARTPPDSPLLRSCYCTIASEVPSPERLTEDGGDPMAACLVWEPVTRSSSNSTLKTDRASITSLHPCGHFLGASSKISISASLPPMLCTVMAAPVSQNTSPGP